MTTESKTVLENINQEQGQEKNNDIDNTINNGQNYNFIHKDIIEEMAKDLPNDLKKQLEEHGLSRGSHEKGFRTDVLESVKQYKEEKSRQQRHNDLTKIVGSDYNVYLDKYKDRFASDEIDIDATPPKALKRFLSLYMAEDKQKDEKSNTFVPPIPNIPVSATATTIANADKYYPKDDNGMKKNIRSTRSDYNRKELAYEIAKNGFGRKGLNDYGKGLLRDEINSIVR
ncbi:hypothetical protein AB832_06295 [Flavobacteriaceae bacterium (ex Bugula neritina AB1)]|nr:hypothetical protein AB832_06295 [Flavobacteriaceae bacterium (ex Bugula neritina AB1)]